MSDSEASDAPSQDANYERALRDAVVTLFKKNRDEVTVKTARTAAEKTLGVQAGFFKGDATWNPKSKDIATEEVQRLEEEANTAVQSSPVAPKKPTPTPAKKASKPAKRASADEEPQPKQKRRKKESEPTSGDDLSSAPSDFSEQEEKPKPKKAVPKVKKTSDASGTGKKPAKKQTQKPAKSSKKDEKVVSDDSDTATKSAENKTAPADASESEMSEVLDEEPKRRKKRKSSETATTSKPIKKKPTAAASKGKDLDPDEAEIKRLQGWLIKCGIRKVWGVELKQYDTLKARIKHLKQMLDDVGMTGRYSQEKASEIKERRELAADLEEVQAGAERWGKEGDDENEERDSKPKRRLVKGAKAFDFLSSDGEETD